MQVFTADEPPTTRPRGNGNARLLASADGDSPSRARHRVAAPSREVGGSAPVGIVGAGLEQQHRAVECSVTRRAMTQPAEPAPTTIRSGRIRRAMLLKTHAPRNPVTGAMGAPAGE